MMANMPSNASMQYGATHPINVYKGDYLSQDTDLNATLRRELVDAGVNGLAFEITARSNSSSPGVRHFIEFIKRFAHTSIPIAPCINVGNSPDDVINAIAHAYRASKTYGNAAIMRDGRLIVFLYQANNLTSSQWYRLRAELAAANVKVFLAGDVSQLTLQVAQASGRAAAVVAPWDAAFNFNGTGLSDQPHSNLAFGRAVTAEGRRWIGSVRPSYYRGVDVPLAWGPFGVDSAGTARLRSQWDQILQTTGAPWVYWSTLNDYVEHTNLLADSNWGYTRSDLNAWYSSKFRETPYPFPPALYLTTPQALHAGERSVAELLVINPSSVAIGASLRLVASDGALLGTARLSVPPHRHAALSLPVTAYGNTVRRYARAEAIGPVATIVSAPILLGTEAKLPSDHSVPNYYSVNSRLRPPSNWHPVIKIDGKFVQVTGLDPTSTGAVDLLVDGNLRDQILFPPATPVLLRTDRILKFSRDSNDNKASIRYGTKSTMIVRIVLRNGATWYSPPL
ncbi:hypothetical protein BV97_05735 [Novosphingobium resinovorum]|uniref:Uncharacterized protein n=2 Tax=Novosphingobium resinovorum TaxID=158500 RepID=A0A031J1T9_9SPHN|nr:hypothetical protein BV97_05735 [Novosphingobium resinovorum]